MSATATLRPGNAGPQKNQEVVGLETGKNSEGHQHARRRSTSLDAAERLSLYISVSSTLHFSCITPSLSGGGGRYGTDGTHYEYSVMPWNEYGCGLWGRMPRILDAGANKTQISHNPLRIPRLFWHCPSTILSKLEPVAGLGLLACPSCSSGQLRRLRKLHQFALNSCDNTGSWEDLQQFVQRTSTVCPVRSQKNDFQIWCPF